MASKTENRRVNLYINGQEVTNSIRAIQAEYRKLVNEQKDMIRGSKEYQENVKKLSRLKTILNQHYQAVNKTAGVWGSLQKAAGGFNQYFSMIAAGVATVTGLVMSFRRAADAANIFEERVDNLSALTGLSGSELGWLADKAKQTSVALVENNIRIKQSATDIVDAYTRMGSQRPELLQNKEALHEVTLNAIILSEAAKGKLEPSVTALATTMNQFNQQAGNSREIINTIAAGSKAGAADIEYLSTAVEKSGTSMALLGMSVEEGVAIIETVAPKFSKARVAGNSLDKVLLKMREKQIGFVNGAFDMNSALDELQVRFSKGETATQLFGAEHAKMVEVMVQGKSEFNRYLQLVTDTDIALEQAAKNTNNRATQLAQAKNKITLLAIELGEQLSPAMTKAYLGFGTLMKVAIALPRIIKENQTVIIALTGAILAYNARRLQSIALLTQEIAIKYKNLTADKLSFVFGSKGLLLTNARAIAAKSMIGLTGKMTVAQGRAIVAQRTLNATMTANPFGAIILAITGVIAALKLYDKYNAANLRLERQKTMAVEELKSANDALQCSYDAISSDVSHLNRLSLQEKKDLQEKISKTLELAEAELLLHQARRKQIHSDAFKATTWDYVSNTLSAVWNSIWVGQSQAMGQLGTDLVESMKENADEATSEIDEQIQAMLSHIENLKDQGVDLSEILTAESTADKIGSETLVNLEEKLNLYQIALRNAVKGSQDFVRIQQKIAEVEKQMGGFQGDYNTEDEVRENERLAKEKQRIEQQLYDSITQIRRQLNLDKLSAEQKEIQQAEYKYQDLIAKTEEYGLDVMALTQLREEEISAITNKWEEKRTAQKQKAQARIEAILMSERETAVHQTTKKYQELIELAEEHGLETTELYQAMNQELAEIQNQTFSDEQGENRDIFGMSQDDWDVLLENVQAAIAVAQQFGEIWSAVNARRTAEEDAAMRDYEAHIQYRKDLLEEQLESGIISQASYDRQVSSLDDQLDKRKKELAIKQWQRDKELRHYSAIINTAAGITQALGSMPPPYSYILAALTAVLGGVQIAAIANEPPPAFRYGGFTPDRPTMALVGDDYKKEWVASGDLVCDPKAGPIIEQLEAYQRGLTSDIRFSPAVQPSIENITTTRTPEFNSSLGASSLQYSENEVLQGIHQQLLQMNESSDRMNNYLSDPNNRRSTISYDLLKEYEQELSDIQSLSRTSS